jgi:hypothetical protein
VIFLLCEGEEECAAPAAGLPKECAVLAKVSAQAYDVSAEALAKADKDK